MPKAGPLILTLLFAVLPLQAAASELVPVRIGTEPPGARVYIDGVLRGETPASLQMPAGEHDIFLYKPGMLPVARREVWSADERPILRETLRTQRGGVVVLSDPPRAEVVIDGRAVGVTPIAFEDMPPGRYRIELRRKGFEPWRSEIDVGGGQPALVDVRLVGPPVYLWVEAARGSAVYLDGSYAGDVTGDSLGLRVRPGTHELRIVRGGFASVQQLVIEPGRDAFAQEGEMQRIPNAAVPERAALNPRWYAVAGGSAVALGGATLAVVSAVQASGARDDYESAWRRAEIADARGRIVSANRLIWVGSGLAALGAAGVWWAWPSAPAAIGFRTDGVTLTWRMAP